MFKTHAHRTLDMTQGPVFSQVIFFALPIMLSSILQLLFNAADLVVVGRYCGSISGAAVGATGSITNLIVNLFIGLSVGAGVTVAHALGSREQTVVHNTVHTALPTALVSGVFLTVVGVSLSKTFLIWMETPANILPLSTLYMQIYFGGMVFNMVYNFCAAIMRSSGDSKRPMIYLTIAGVVKVLLTYAFVAFFNMRVEGVALATIISWALSAALALVSLFKEEGITKINPKKLRFYKDEVKEILFIGLPVGLQNGLWAIANVVISAAVNSFGPDATTGVSIANNYDGILYQISTAPGIAVMPYVSQNIGASNVKRAERSVWCGMLITTILGGGFGALSAIFAGPLSSIMSDVPAVIAYSQQKMVIISSTYFICGIYHIMGSALSGMRRPNIPTIATFLFMCVLRFVWVYCVFPFFPNLTFLYLVWPIGWILSIAMELCFYFPTLKKLRHVHAHAEHGADKPAI